MVTKLGLNAFLESYTHLVAGKRVALLACPSSVDQQLRSSVEILHHNPAINLVALFGPEHGIRGEAQAGAKVASAVDPLTGLPAHSLYGATHKPSADMLRDIDVIIIDLQEAGVRFYTFVATTLHVLHAAAENGISVIILDRPAPLNGMCVEGPVLDPDFNSFVGPAPLPIRYGMTIGELALMLNADSIACDLHVVPLANWTRDMWYYQTNLPFVPSSPNLPTLDTVTLYPSTCLIEGTNLSEGRGTTRPFEYIGAPWIDAEQLAEQLNALDLAGLRFRPLTFVPTFSKHQAERCAGVHIYVTDRDKFLPVDAMLHVLQTVKRNYPDEFSWRGPWVPGRHRPIDLLWGGDSLRQHIDADRPVDELIACWQPGLRAFTQKRNAYLLYADA